MRPSEDMVRVRWNNITDGLAGTYWTRGLSEPVLRWRAEQIVTLLGHPAEIVEPEAPAPDPTPEPPAPVDSDASAGGDPPSTDPAPDADPAPSALDLQLDAAGGAGVDEAAEAARPRRRGLKS